MINKSLTGGCLGGTYTCSTCQTPSNSGVHPIFTGGKIDVQCSNRYVDSNHCVHTCEFVRFNSNKYVDYNLQTCMSKLCK